MLPKPYEFVYEVGMNKYYYLTLFDTPYTFLSINSADQIEELTKKWYSRKPKTKIIDLPIAQKLLPLNSLVLFTLFNATMLNVKTYEMDVNDEKIEIYEEWDDMDVEILRKTFKTAIVDVAGKSNYQIGYTLSNHVARGLEKDGYKHLAIEKPNALNRTYWFVRTTPYGVVTLIALDEVGTEKDCITTSVNVFMINRELLNIIIEDFKKGKLSPKTDKITMEDIKGE